MAPRYERIDVRDGGNRLLVIDIDGVLAVEQKAVPWEQREVMPEARKALRLFRKKGYAVLLFTSRPRSQKRVTVEWLKKNGLPFDGILFGKPRGILYVDDRAYRFGGWKQFWEDMIF